MAFAGMTLVDLNNYMKNYPSQRMFVNEMLSVGLFDVLKGQFDSENFVGKAYQMLMQVSQPSTAKGHYEDHDIPLPGTTVPVLTSVPIKEMIANAGLTRQAMVQATGGAASWGNVVELALDNLKTDWLDGLQLAAIGHGYGLLGEVSACTESPSTTYTVTFDNTYLSMGWENTARMRVGRRIDVYNGASLVTAAAGVVVTAVTFGDRQNGAATTGTITFTDTTGLTIANGYGVYVHDAHTATAADHGFPMGLCGLVSDGAYFTDSLSDVATFQGLARATYASLRSYIYGAAASGNIIGFGLTSETPVLGTPTTWDLSVISNAISQVKNGTGKGLVDFLLCSSDLAMAIQRRNKAESNMQVTVSTTGNLNQAVVGSQYANQFLTPDGRLIPIKVDETIPKNVLYGLTSKDLILFQKEPFDFLREYGGIWEPSRGDRKTNWEAPYGGFYNMGALRCDNCFVILDMRTDI
jgi:hypothetical protein